MSQPKCPPRAACSCVDWLTQPLQDDVFQNTFGFGRDSNKAAKELGDFGDTLFNISAGEAAAPMEVGGCRGRACEGQGRGGEGAFTGEGGLRACVEGGGGRGGADHRVWLGDVRGHAVLWLNGGIRRNFGRQTGVSLADAPNRAARTPHQSVRHNTASALLPSPLPLLSCTHRWTRRRTALPQVRSVSGRRPRPAARAAPAARPSTA